MNLLFARKMDEKIAAAVARFEEKLDEGLVASPKRVAWAASNLALREAAGFLHEEVKIIAEEYIPLSRKWAIATRDWLEVGRGDSVMVKADWPCYKRALVANSSSTVLGTYKQDANFLKNHRYADDILDSFDPVYEDIEVGLKKRVNMVVNDYYFLTDHTSGTRMVAQVNCNCNMWTPNTVTVTVARDKRDVGAKFVENVRAHMLDHNIYRGQRLAYSHGLLSFLDVETVTWDDLILPGEIISSLRKSTLETFRKRKIYDSLGLGMRRSFLVDGPPGCGKCGKNLLVATDQGLLDLEEIASFTKEEHYEQRKLEVVGRWGKKRRSSHVYCDGKKKAIKIRTRCGFQEIATPKHAIDILTVDGRIKNTCFEDLREGDVAIVSLGTDKWGTNVQAGSVPLTKEVARLLGYLVAEGCLLGRGVEFFNKDQEVLEDFKKCASSVGIECSDSVDNRTGVHAFPWGGRKWVGQQGWSWSYFVDSRMDDRIGMQGKRSRQKSIPVCIRTAPKEIVCQFLKALFEGDGCAYNNGTGWLVEYDTTSPKLSRQLQAVLLNLGIATQTTKSWIGKGNTKYDYRTTILSRSKDRFAEEIGFVSTRKSDILRKVIANIPEVTHGKVLEEWAPASVLAAKVYRKISKIVEESGIVVHVQMQHTVNGNTTDPYFKPRGLTLSDCVGGSDNVRRLSCGTPSVKTFSAIAQLGEGEYKDLFLRDPFLKKAIRTCRNLVSSHLLFDPIVEVTPLKKKQRVYDLVVPKGHLYWANGFTNHNTTIFRALSGEIKDGEASIIWVSGKSIEYPEHVKMLFEAARELTPTFMFLEDVDTFGRTRSGSTLGSSNAILGELLQQLDGAESNKGLIVGASTNDVRAIDYALTARPGRFSRVFQIPLPDADVRSTLLKRFLTRRKCEMVASVDTFNKVIVESEGFTGDYMREIADTATEDAVDADKLDDLQHPVVDDKVLKEAFTKVKSQYDAAKERRDNEQAHFDNMFGEPKPKNRKADPEGLVDEDPIDRAAFARLGQDRGQGERPLTEISDEGPAPGDEVPLPPMSHECRRILKKIKRLTPENVRKEDLR